MYLIAQDCGTDNEQSSSSLKFLAQIERLFKSATALVGVFSEQDLINTKGKLVSGREGGTSKKKKTCAQNNTYFIVRINSRLDLSVENQLHQLVF
jgi:hypothetical protein